MVHPNRQRGFKSWELSESDTLRSSDPRSLNHCYVPSLFWLLGEMLGNKKAQAGLASEGWRHPVCHKPIACGQVEPHQLSASAQNSLHAGNPQRLPNNPFPVCAAQLWQHQALWKDFCPGLSFPWPAKSVSNTLVCLFLGV